MAESLILSESEPTPDRNLVIDIFGDIFNPTVASMNFTTGEVQTSKLNWKKNIDKFFKLFQEKVDVKRVKALVFRAMEYEAMTFKESQEFRLKWKNFCESNGIFYFVGNDIHFNAMAAIERTKTMVEVGEQVLIVMTKFFGLVFTVRLIRDNGFYRYIGSQMYESADMLQIGLLMSEPKKVILFHDSGATPSVFEKVKKILSRFDLEILPEGDGCQLEMEAILFKVFHLMGQRINPYDIRVACSQAWFDVRYSDKSLINIAPNEVLPLERSITINIERVKSVKLFAKFEVIPYELLKEIKLSDFNTKQAKITLKIDINLFYEFIVEPFGPIAEPPSNTPKARISFTQRSFSVFLQIKNNERVLEDFDDLEETPLFISFTGKKPIFGQAALITFFKKPKFAVYDLMRLCSISSIDSVDPSWEFKVEKEGENVMVIVETTEGERKSSVAFILALILKHALLLVKNEIGKKLEEIEIGFNGFSPNETLKNNFVEAGKLVNVKITFD